MALINCPFCGQQISDLAKTCPKCGANVSSSLSEKRKYCMYCGMVMPLDAQTCPKCGKKSINPSDVDKTASTHVQASQSRQPQQTIYIQQPKSNGIGVAGFVLSIIALFVSWVPVLDVIIWFLGLLFSFIGIFKSPRGFAIAGLIISCLGIIITIIVFGSFLGLLGAIGASSSY